MMTRSPRLCIHWSPPRRLTALRPQALRLVHSYHTVPSAHLFLRAPLATSQAKQCQLRSPRPSRSSHFLSSYSAATSKLLLFSRLSYQSPFHPWTPLCRRLHPVMPLRMCPPRRLISLSPRYLLTWQCRRLSTVSHTSSLDAAVHTIPHSALSQDVSAQMGSRSASSFSVDVFVQNTARSVVLHDVATQLPLTEFFIGCIFSNDPLDRQNFDRQRPSSAQGDIGSVSPPPLPDIVTTCTLTRSSLDCDHLVRTLAPRALLQPPPGIEQYAPPPGLAIDAHLRTPLGILVTAAPLRPRLRSAISVTRPTAPCLYHPCGNTSCTISYF